MKKSLAIAMVFLSGSTLASEKVKAQAQPPMMKVAVYDFSNKVTKDVGDTYSRSNKNLRLCWAAFNMSFDPTNKNKVIQTFVAPNNKAKFSSSSGTTAVSADGKNSTVTSVLPSRNNEVIEECWKFDNTDPLGKYTLTVQVNDVRFAGYTFELVK